MGGFLRLRRAALGAPGEVPANPSQPLPQMDGGEGSHGTGQPGVGLCEELPLHATQRTRRPPASSPPSAQPGPPRDSPRSASEFLGGCRGSWREERPRNDLLQHLLIGPASPLRGTVPAGCRRGWHPQGSGTLHGPQSRPTGRLAPPRAGAWLRRALVGLGQR